MLTVGHFGASSCGVLALMAGGIYSFVSGRRLAGLHEIEISMDISFQRLLLSGNRVGRDILGTTVNTLCFAGLGESLMLSLYLMMHGFTFGRLINSEALYQEFGIIFIGSLGCILVIPLTVGVVSIVLYKRGEQRKPLC